MNDDLVGKKLCAIEPLTPGEAATFGLDPHQLGAAVVLVFENGVRLVPSRDAEGNGPGCMFGLDPRNLGTFRLMASLGAE